MRTSAIVMAIVTFAILVPASSSAQESPDAEAGYAVCFAPGTPQSVIEEYARKGLGVVTSHPDEDYTFSDLDRWQVTATDGGGLDQGDPCTLTWTIVPDGTPVEPRVDGESTDPSNLQARLNVIYGSEAVWLPLFERVFDAWGSFIGITYVYEPNDDGSEVRLGNIPGEVGVRADVRIAGHRIDGDYNVLARNAFPPQGGDMVMDTADRFFSDTTSDSLNLRNVLAHEHGHGLGIQHVCPINETKLMEPVFTPTFEGPQHDDIAVGNRGYGDRFESNDWSTRATDLGTLGAAGNVVLQDLSIDNDSDRDMFKIETTVAAALSASVEPIGFTYSSGPQNPIDGSCPPGPDFDTLNVHDLRLELLNSGGGSLATENETGTGSPELLEYVLDTPGVYFVRVRGDATNASQLYDLTIATSGLVGGVTLYEASGPADVTNPSNAVWPDATSPIDWTPAGDPELYYEVDDGTGLPARIDVIKTPGGIRITF